MMNDFEIINKFIRNIIFDKSYEYMVRSLNIYCDEYTIIFDCNRFKVEEFENVIKEYLELTKYKYVRVIFDIRWKTVDIELKFKIIKKETKTPPECFEPSCTCCEYKSKCKNNDGNKPHNNLSELTKSAIGCFVDKFICKIKNDCGCNHIILKELITHRIDLLRLYNDDEKQYALEYFNKYYNK